MCAFGEFHVQVTPSYGKLQIQFFAHLTMAKVVSPDSMISLLQAFTSVLDEFGVSHGRAKRAAMCAAEGLMFVSV